MFYIRQYIVFKKTNKKPPIVHLLLYLTLLNHEPTTDLQVNAEREDNNFR